MTRQEMQEALAATFVKILKTIKEKNNDYAGQGAEADPFFNFKFGAAFSGVSPVQSVMVRIGDKLSRIHNLLGDTEQAVLDESVEDTIDDAIAYFGLLKIMLQQETQAEDEDTKTSKSWFSRWLSNLSGNKTEQDVNVSGATQS